MINPLVSLAFNVHANKGVYALLLGSGVSRSAGIPTGWEVVLDLIRKLASAEGENCDPDPEAWYVKKHGEQPDYAKLLDALTRTPTERNALLKSYFEPTETEREQGKKLPTPAHKAIAQLVSKGFIRVILTTNFDQLMESALRGEGVNPTVISTADAAEGAVPLTHNPCVVIKLHGDYLDTRIKNTPDELATYDLAMKKLLRRVFDEYGLVICGWSGDWDTALRGCIERCKSFRYGTVWASRGKPGASAEKLVTLRQASLVSIAGADEFFVSLAEKVTGLETFARPHPLSKAVAVATLKGYLADDVHRIRLHDLIHDETEATVKQILAISSVNEVPNHDIAGARIAKYEAATETLSALFATGCYWGRPSTYPRWREALERVGNCVTERAGYEYWSALRLYPALLLSYAGCLSACAINRFDLMAELLRKAHLSDENRDDVPAVDLLVPAAIVAYANQIPYVRNLNNHLFGLMREQFRPLVPDDDKFEMLFDRFEYLRSMVYCHWYLTKHQLTDSIPGRFVRRGRTPSRRISKIVADEISKDGRNWLPLNPLFDGIKLEELTEIKKVHDEHLIHAR